MPVYEYECDACEKVFEVQQKMADAPLASCPDCSGAVRKLMSMNSFHLKGGGWYADGYTSKGTGKSKSSEENKATPPPCQTDGSCKGCPAAADS